MITPEDIKMWIEAGFSGSQVDVTGDRRPTSPAGLQCARRKDARRHPCVVYAYSDTIGICSALIAKHLFQP